MPRIRAGDFVFRCGRKILAVKELLDQFLQISPLRFMGEVRSPEEAIVAQEFDIALGGVFFATLKEKLLPGQ